MDKVIIVESGAKTKTIRGFLRGEYDVVACGGHIMDLPDEDLGVDVEDGFTYSLEPLHRRNGDAVESIASRIEGANEVYLATDPDREGEAIAADLRDHAVPSHCDVHRIEFNAIVYPAVRDALENPRDVDEQRVEAQRTRRVLDRLIGFILSRHAQFDSDGPQAPSVGRVQSPAIRLVVDREREIEDFEPRNYWTIHADLSHESETFEAELDGEWDEFEAGKNVVESLQDRGMFTVESCEVDPHSEMNPLPPYTTDALQNDADYLLNFSPERTMELAQQLYEGVEIEDGDDAESKALITYMRTDSTRVSPSALNLAKETLTKRTELGEELYKGRTWEASGNVQDAHEAIRPTQPEEPKTWPENLEETLDEPLLELYTLIYKRFLASQMVPAVYRTTTLDLECGEYQAQTIGHELLDPGFLDVWRDIRPDHGRTEIDVPEVDLGAEFTVDRAWPEPRETQPPPRYREGSLISELKDRGVGRPSTYSEIIRKIKRGQAGFGYVKKTGKSLRPTEKGRDLVEYLEQRFEHVVDYEYTARMEDDLDRIEGGELTYREVLETEFDWLRDPYEHALSEGWLDPDRPSPKQIEYLESLSEETGIEIPDDVYESKAKTSEWIDKLLEKIDPYIRLTEIYDADVQGVSVNRLRLYFNKPLGDEEYGYLKGLGMKYIEGGKDHPPGFQFQRQDLEVVQEIREQLRDRYSDGDTLTHFELKEGDGR